MISSGAPGYVCSNAPPLVFRNVNDGRCSREWLTRVREDLTRVLWTVSKELDKNAAEAQSCMTPHLWPELVGGFGHEALHWCVLDWHGVNWVFLTDGSPPILSRVGTRQD